MKEAKSNSLGGSLTAHFLIIYIIGDLMNCDSGPCSNKAKYKMLHVCGLIYYLCEEDKELFKGLDRNWKGKMRLIE